MMQVTRAAFQAVASLNEQATDPKSHTLVKNSLQDYLGLVPPWAVCIFQYRKIHSHEAADSASTVSLN